MEVDHIVDHVVDHVVDHDTAVAAEIVVGLEIVNYSDIYFDSEIENYLKNYFDPEIVAGADSFVVGHPEKFVY